MTLFMGILLVVSGVLQGWACVSMNKRLLTPGEAAASVWFGYWGIICTLLGFVMIPIGIGQLT